MELREFVSRTLIDIVRGVAEAQASVEDSGARVNPSLTRVRPSEAAGAVLGWTGEVGGVPVLLAEFDVAVTASEGSQVNAGVAVLGGIVSLGSKASADEAASSASRVRFSVPLVLPSTKLPGHIR